ncbi:methyl-accepting chemotaxis protein [Bacillus massilinigeriensis]|uniref:methyl-accepting chemotaxis protein n=1 Tax=Bacillus massilionigeriensis TaxID=1805475 RepID=UPI000A031E40
MIMFIKKKKSLIDEQTQLLEENARLKSELAQKAVETKDFMDKLQEELLTTIDQHEKVNGQHGEMANLVAMIKAHFEKASSQVEDSSEKAKEMRDKGTKLIQAAEIMGVRGQEGQTIVSNMENLIEKLGQEMQQNLEAIKMVGQRSKEIDEIVFMIKGIAEQTNLLALNASIEAARAGEYGKGFSVVAEEVRKLAEETASSSQGIMELTQSFQKDIEAAVTNSNELFSLVQSGMNLGKQTTSKISEIEEIIKEVHDQVQSVQSLIRDQNGSCNNALNEMRNTGVIFDEVNQLITNHIEAAEIVDRKLENGVSQLKDREVENLH